MLISKTATAENAVLENRPAPGRDRRDPSCSAALLSARWCASLPGFDSDERGTRSPGLSAESVRALRQSRAGEHNILSLLRVSSAPPGTADLGHFSCPRPPVQSLLRRALAGHFARGRRWACCWAVAAGIAAGLHRLPVACSGRRDDGDTLSGAFLCIPAAVLGFASR